MSNVEKILDEKMNNFLEKGLVKKIVKNDLMKQILNSSFMENISKSLDSSWVTIMQVLGILAIIFGVLGFITLLGVGGLGTLFGGIFSIKLMLSIILGFVRSFLSVIGGRGMLKMKKRLPCIYTIGFFIIILSTIVNTVGWGGQVNYISFIISIFFWFLVLKKRKTFIK